MVQSSDGANTPAFDDGTPEHDPNEHSAHLSVDSPGKPDLLAPDPDLATEVRPLIDLAATDYRDGLATATKASRAIRYRREATGWVLTQIGTADEPPPTAQDLARIVALLRDRTIRDVMFSLAATLWHRDAEALWRQIASVTAGSDRAQAATLFGYSAYLRDDTAVAASALTTALRADPNYAMAKLLAIALSDCHRLDRIRSISTAAAEIAADLGIDTTTS
ncbi:DUF4192 family protein [Nocardia salmonicida]|uniref:DUF4192 family protein n=1 Tax=Nocardia salmonicida TaxID=53431 RepID=UPI0034240872